MAEKSTKGSAKRGRERRFARIEMEHTTDHRGRPLRVYRLIEATHDGTVLAEHKVQPTPGQVRSGTEGDTAVASLQGYAELRGYTVVGFPDTPDAALTRVRFQKARRHNREVIEQAYAEVTPPVPNDHDRGS